MANVNSISGNSSSVSSLFANRNTLSGLASGLDTEAMIENSVSGYQTKISQLEQEQTKVQWKQDGIREIVDQAAALTSKYASYSSSANLMSTSFYANASAVTVNGDYASKVTASGSSSSTVEILGVSNLATNTTYAFSPDASWGSASNNSTGTISLSSRPSVNKNAGIVTLNYGENGDKSIQFEIGDFEKTDNADQLANAVRSKLKGLTVTNAKGEMVKATDYFKVSVQNGSMKIEAQDYRKNGDDWVSNTTTVTPRLQKSDANSNSTFSAAGGTVSSSKTLAHYLSGKSINVTYNGLDKKITFPMKEPQPPFDTLAQMGKYIEEQLNEMFSTDGEDVITVDTSGSKLTFNFTDPSKSNSLKITSDFNEVLGLDAKKGLDTKVDTSKTTLENVLGRNWNQPLTINGVTISTNFNKDSTIQDVMTAINNNSGRTGVTVSYSNTSSQFIFTATETGSAHEIQLGGLAQALFGAGKGEAGYLAGQDAELTVKSNGVEQTLRRSSNTVDLDGLKVTLKGTFETAANQTGVTFSSSANSDRIVDTVKAFVTDFNKLATSLRTAFTTQPAKKSDGSAYEPLTENDRNSMSETAIKNYEENAKQGLLFGDSDLSSMYSKLIRQIAPSGSDKDALAAIGISTTYKDGLTTLTLDENKLRSSLEGGTEEVRKAFADSSYGAGDGIVGRLKTMLDRYASTSMTSPGVLVRKAGSKLSATSLLNNALQKQSDRIQTEKERVQAKMSSKVDYYTRQFTKLEQLMNTMNNQSSMLAGMLGGG